MKKVKKSEKYGYETKLVVKRAAKMAENVFHGYFRVPPKEKKLTKRINSLNIECVFVIKKSWVRPPNQNWHKN